MQTVIDTFTDVVIEHGEDLLIYAHSIIKDPELATDLVQDVLAIAKKEGILDNTILPPFQYLLNKVREACLFCE